MSKRWVVMVLVFACGGRDRDMQAIDAPQVIDTAIDAAPSESADIATTLQCGPTPAVQPLQPDLQRAIIDTTKFPEALCNDGTAAVLFFRPYTGAANRNKWVLNLHGGGSCGSGPTCAARWCNCTTVTECPFTTVPTYFDRLQMTNARPPTIGGNGVFERGGTGMLANPIGDYNQVELQYCSSDGWRGNLRALALTAPNPKTGVEVTFRVNFLGSKILDSDIAWLRQDGVAGLVYTLSGNTPLPDLDDATDVIVTGGSAGGAGVVTNLDHVRDLLSQHNTNPTALQVTGLIDAFVGLDRAPLDYGTYYISQVRSYDNYLTFRATAPSTAGARSDTSCVQMHAADPRICSDETHVVRNHLTTPFFVRSALRDDGVTSNYIEEAYRMPDLSPMSVNGFALRLHTELTQFSNLKGSAEEGPQMPRNPGVFAPGCTNHDTIRESSQTYGTTITPAGGSALTLLQVFENWRNATGGTTNVLTQSAQLMDTNCP